MPSAACSFFFPAATGEEWKDMVPTQWTAESQTHTLLCPAELGCDEGFNFPMPHFPSRSLSQLACMPFASGVTAPIPVTTTRRWRITAGGGNSRAILSAAAAAAAAASSSPRGEMWGARQTYPPLWNSGEISWPRCRRAAEQLWARLWCVCYHHQHPVHHVDQPQCPSEKSRSGVHPDYCGADPAGGQGSAARCGGQGASPADHR